MTTTTRTLADFLLARVSEDEAVAQDALERGFGGWEHFADKGVSYEERTHIALHHPARVLAECAAKREVVRLAPAESCERAHPTADAHHPGGHDSPILLAMARAYADHPDFREEWAW